MTKNILGNLNLKEALQLARTKKKEKSYDEVASICSDILLEFPHNKNALKFRPELAEAHCNLGIVYKNLGDTENAFECYENALKIYKN